MGAYIRRVFVTARRFFQTPVRALPPNFSSLEVWRKKNWLICSSRFANNFFFVFVFFNIFLQEYLFNPKVLISAGPPPNDRGCLICGKVGHKAKECENRGNRNRGRDKNSPQQQPRDNPQNPAQEVHNRNMAQQRDRGVGPGQQQQQINRYRPQGFHQMNRDRPGQQQQQQPFNRYRPVRANNRPGVPLNSGERIFTARRDPPDANHQ